MSSKQTNVRLSIHLQPLQSPLGFTDRDLGLHHWGRNRVDNIDRFTNFAFLEPPIILISNDWTLFL